MAQDLPLPRRLLILTQAFLDSAEVREPPVATPGDQSHVLVLFRLAESGSVIDTRATGGSERARSAAVVAVKGWRFKPTLLGGHPVEMQSGAVIDFSSIPVRVQAPSPISSQQISPVLSNQCFLAISKSDADAVATCKKEVRSVDMNRSHTEMESASAHDELGVALLRFAKEPGQALAEFKQSIELARQGLTAADGEMGQLYWHRAEAQKRLNQAGDASADFALAARSFLAAEAARAEGASWYRTCFENVTRQHASLLESEGKHDDAEALLKTIAQKQ